MLASAVLSLFPTSKRYRRISTFTGIEGSIHTLALSTDGQILAAGGTQGVRFWNLKSRKEFPRVATYLDSHGAVSCAVWVKTKFAISEMLCYGTGMGYLVFLRSNPTDMHYQEICARRLGSGFEITCIAWDAVSTDSSCQIAIGTRDNIVQVLVLSAAYQLQSVFAGRLDNTVPKHVAFAEAGSIYVFGLYNGNVIKMNSKDGTIIAENRCQSVIGSAAVNFKKGIFIVDNAADGFTMYRLESGQPIRTFTMNLASIPVPKQVAFGEESKVAIGGSDTGCVYVFNRRTGALIETLRHTNSILVQTIAVSAGPLTISKLMHIRCAMWVGIALLHVHPLLSAERRL
ncbi:WD40-repeat-containing domain protein [Pisolithus albus]|nr:WD40-repeat-containing domain protein [Pisolithus albus]